MELVSTPAPAAAGRVVCFGELLLRLSPPGRTRLLQLPMLDAHFGGAEANVAAALARVGEASAMVSIVPDDPIGDAAVSALRAHGVDTGPIARADGRLGLYFLDAGGGPRAASVLYDRSDSVFARAPADAFDWPALLAGAGWLHLSGITPALGPGGVAHALAAARAARAAGVPVSFDGNWRGRLWERWNPDPAPTLCELVALADLLLGNHRDISLLLGEPLGGDTADARRAAALACFARFPRLRWIAGTARTVDAADRHRLSARIDAPDEATETPELVLHAVVDRIGAGDAFAAGVLARLDRGKGNAEAAARLGLALAALKHYTPGDTSLATLRDVAALEAGGLDVRR